MSDAMIYRLGYWGFVMQVSGLLIGDFVAVKIGFAACAASTIVSFTNKG